MAEGVYAITEQFEKKLSEYTGAPYVVTVDNQSNGMLLALLYANVKGKEISIPSRTYPSVPSMIIIAGGKVKFLPDEGTTLKGEYQLLGTNIWDSALKFTTQMYRKNQVQLVSFTGPYKNLKLGKGGAILLDSFEEMLWLKRARYSGRRECSYHNDNFDALGFNFYMEPEKAVRGLQLMEQFYDRTTGLPKDNADICLPYPDLSKFPIYTDDKLDKWGR